MGPRSVELASRAGMLMMNSARERKVELPVINIKINNEDDRTSFQKRIFRRKNTQSPAASTWGNRQLRSDLKLSPSLKTGSSIMGKKGSH